MRRLAVPPFILVVVLAGLASGARSLLAQGQPATVYLPFAGQGVSQADIPRPPTLAATATAAATPTATRAPSPTTVPCGGLEERMTVQAVDVSPAQVKARPGRRTRGLPVMLAVVPGGVAVAWADTAGSVHVTAVDDAGQRMGEDVIVPGDEVRGFVAGPDGYYSLLVVRGDEMHLVLYSQRSPEETVDTRIVGGVSKTRSGSKWVDDWGHEGRLVWDGEKYAAYFGHTQNWGAQGKHQGDLLWFFDAAGQKIEVEGEGWDWGCSHSLDLRLAHNGTRLGPACLSDAYPSKGFHFNHRTSLIRSEPSGNARGYSAANLGGWVPRADGFLMSLTSPEGRRSSDVGMIHVANDGRPGPAMWLTDTPGVDESAPHLAAYGPRLLAGWTGDGQGYLAEVAGDGTVVVGPDATTAEVGPRDDFVTLPGGDVAWAYVWGNPSELKIVRERWCEFPGARP